MRTAHFLASIVTMSVLLSGQDSPPKQILPQATLAPVKEPGERLKLTVRVYQADGKTPVPNQTLFVYHTDATGVYSTPTNNSRTPRLRGWVRTDASGKFELDTIKPASYPAGGNPAHIHVVFMQDDRSTGEDECWFEGDRYLSQAMKQRESKAGRFSRIVQLWKNGNGGWTGEWNVIKKTE